MEDTQKENGGMAIAEKQQEEQSAKDTQVLAMSPPHDTSTPTEAIIV